MAKNIRMETDDRDVFHQLPRNMKRFYDKLWIAKSQNLSCGSLSDSSPFILPAVIKPRVNLAGFGIGMSVARKKNDILSRINDMRYGELIWMPFFVGDVLSTDMVIANGSIVQNRTVRGVPNRLRDGSFEWWQSEPYYKIPQRIRRWIRKYFFAFTGVVNMELIGDKMIECHLRLGEDTFALDDCFWNCLKNPNHCDSEHCDSEHCDSEHCDSEHQILELPKKPIRNFFFPVFRPIGSNLSPEQKKFMKDNSDESCIQSHVSDCVVGKKQRQAIFTTRKFEKGRNLQRNLQA
jgi:hypothetical protein